MRLSTNIITITASGLTSVYAHSNDLSPVLAYALLPAFAAGLTGVFFLEMRKWVDWAILLEFGSLFVILAALLYNLLGFAFDFIPPVGPIYREGVQVLCNAAALISITVLPLYLSACLITYSESPSSKGADQ